MTKNTEKRGYTFECSGRSFQANLDIIGISANLSVYEGYDGDLTIFQGEPWTEEKTKLTSSERQELADYMIARWTAYRDRAGT